MRTDSERISILKKGTLHRGPVVCWMSRDQRIDDNWALIYAQDCALENHVPLVIAFCLVIGYAGATARHFDFMLKGLEETANKARERSIPFILLYGDPAAEIPAFVRTIGAGMLVTDFDPVRVKHNWHTRVADAIDIPFHEVDAHNIVPCRIASDKKEFAASTFRPKINRKLSRFFTVFPEIKPHPYEFDGDSPEPDWIVARRLSANDNSVAPVPEAVPGGMAARRILSDFIDARLTRYEMRNDPNAEAVSTLSPYLHFGQIAAQRVALEVEISPRFHTDAAASFLEELIVRRELSDNFCFYEPSYDSIGGAHNWARETLENHREDVRDYVYSREDFERASTHDPLWNAAQTELLVTGRMHGYMRMYWAKKILEWTSAPEEALATAVYLNDRYALDGRDPNGYVGCMWSIAGVHDRAWSERPVFGKIRYMNDNGCRRKFDVERYIERIESLKK